MDISHFDFAIQARDVSTHTDYKLYVAAKYMPLYNLTTSALCLSKTLDNFFWVQHHFSSPSLPKLPVSRPQVVYF